MINPRSVCRFPIRSDNLPMAYLVLLAGFPILLLYNRRLGFALIFVAIVLLYRSRTRGAPRVGRNRVTDDERPGRRLKQWKDPWGTGTQ